MLVWVLERKNTYSLFLGAQAGLVTIKINADLPQKAKNKDLQNDGTTFVQNPKDYVSYY